MSKLCNYCGGKGQMKACTTFVDLTIMHLSYTTTDVSCPICKGKGIILTEPPEIVDEFLRKMGVKK